MGEEKRGFLTFEKVPSLCVGQAITVFFSPFMSSTSRAMLNGVLREAHCVLVENLAIEVGELFAKKLRSVGAKVNLRTANGNTKCLCMHKR